MIVAGFDSQAKRQYGVWDLRNPESPISTGPLIEGSGVSYIWYDRAYSKLIVVGRGDPCVAYYDFNRGSPEMLTHLQNFVFAGSVTSKGFALAPKHSVDVSQ